MEENLLRKNLEILKRVREESGAKILLAQKAFSMFHFYPLLREYLDGTTASGIYEAKLGAEEFGKQTHVFSPAYRDSEFTALLEICDHIVLNSFSQWQHFKAQALQSGKSFGLRVNPECSTQEGHVIYDPCAPGSRLGILAKDFEGQDLTGIEGLHFHTLCEQNVDDLIPTLQAFEEKFPTVVLNIYSSEVKKLLKKYPFLKVSPNPETLSKELRNREYKYQFDITKMEEKIIVDFLEY